MDAKATELREFALMNKWLLLVKQDYGGSSPLRVESRTWITPQGNLVEAMFDGELVTHVEILRSKEAGAQRA